MPAIAKYWLINEPTTTMINATQSISTPNFWYLGSLPPLISGVKYKPAIKKAVAIQNKAAWTCHVRTNEYGK